VVQRLFNEAEESQRQQLADLMKLYAPMLKSLPHAGKLLLKAK